MSLLLSAVLNSPLYTRLYFSPYRSLQTSVATAYFRCPLHSLPSLPLVPTIPSPSQSGEQPSNTVSIHSYHLTHSKPSLSTILIHPVVRAIMNTFILREGGKPLCRTLWLLPSFSESVVYRTKNSIPSSEEQGLRDANYQPEILPTLHMLQARFTHYLGGWRRWLVNLNERNAEVGRKRERVGRFFFEGVGGW